MKTRLNELITLPTSFTYKVIAVARPKLIDDIREVVSKHHGEDCLIKMKRSKAGRYYAVSVTINASRIKQIETLYEKIAELPSVQIVL